MKTKSFFLILALAVAPELVVESAIAQDVMWAAVVSQASLPLFDSETYLGEVEAKVQGETILSLDRESLIGVLSERYNEDVLQSIRKEVKDVSPLKLPFKLTYNVQELRLEIKTALNQRASSSTNLREDYDRQFAHKALAPAAVGGAINYRIEQSYAPDRIGGRPGTHRISISKDVKGLQDIGVIEPMEDEE